MRRLALGATLFLVVTALIAAFPYTSQPGGDEVTSLYSPLFLSGGTSVSSTASPQADAINPAASGAAQRPVLDLSYIGLGTFGSLAGYTGTAVNLGLTYPTNYGVFTGSGHFLGSGALGSGAGMDIGSLGSLNVSFSKDLYSDLLIGAGLNVTLGTGPSDLGSTFDWGLGLNLGVIGMPGDVPFFKLFTMRDLVWGIAFDGIGKGFAPVSGSDAYPPPFTPAAGVSFSLVQTKLLDVGLVSDLSFPSFSDVRLDLGTNVTIANVATLRLSTALSATSLFGVNPGRFFPLAGGLTLEFKANLPSNLKYLADKGWTRSEINPTISVTPLANNTIAFGGGVNIPLGVIDTTPPAITVSYPDEKWISPNNDGVQDFVDIPVTITDNKFVYGYKFVVYDSQGAVVREIDNPDYRPESQGVQNVIDRLLAVKSGIPIPAYFRWDGKNNIGQVVPDGSYTFDVTAFDENNNSATSQRYTIHVKNTPPKIDLKPMAPDDLIFSPGGTGLKTTLEITLTGSVQDLWTGKFIDSSGKTVRTMTWKNSAPQSFLWDGKDDQGQIVPDGVYSFVISATDPAGNTASATIHNIIVNTVATPIAVMINPSAFSPGTKSPVQTVNFNFEVPVRTDIVSWQLQIVDSSGSIVRTVKGGSDIPTLWVYDGKDQNGGYLAEGVYHGVLSVLYRNGHNPQATSPGITVDVTAPTAHLTADYLVFSPTGDSPRNDMIFHATSSQEQAWTGTVQTADGTPVKTFNWIGQPDATITWDGRGDNGQLQPDGTYKFLVESIDEAGNFGQSNVITFTLDTEKKQVFINADYDAFSPNGVRNAVHLTPQLKTTNGFQSYSFNIVDKSGASVYSSNGTSVPTTPFTWNGKKPDGTLAPDGLYRGELAVSYSNGSNPKGVSGWFSLTTKLPSVSVSASPLLFSPNGDGQKDTVAFTQTSSQSTLWTGKVLRADGQVVRTWNWPGQAPSFTWDGTDSYGNTVHDGTYSYVVSTTDEAGNSAQASVTGIVVDNRPTQAFVTVDRSGFSPNGDGTVDDVTFAPFVTLKDGIDTWTLDMVTQDGTLVKRFSGSRSAPPDKITWNGKSDNGQIVEGSYVGRLTVNYLKGDIDTATTRPFVLDVTPPAVTVNLSPIPFAPDNSSPANSVLTIAISVKAPVDVDQWSFKIFDPTKQPFYTFSGVGNPASQLYWNGLSSSGELVQSASDYPYTLTVRDVLGNTQVVNGTISTGVLVMKEGDQYLIRISSINFAPFSADLVTQQQDPVLYAKNMQVLDLIAQTLKRYSTYKIRLEGNAVSVFWQDPARAAVEQRDTLIPLSLARAETVKQALIARGISPDRMTTVGLGAANPIVPFSDAVNLWKDRRVDFVLVKD